MDLTEAEYIKKRWQEYTEELYKKDLHDQDNHDSVIIYLVKNCSTFPEWKVENLHLKLQKLILLKN